MRIRTTPHAGRPELARPKSLVFTYRERAIGTRVSIVPPIGAIPFGEGPVIQVFLPGTDYIATFYRATPGELLAKSHAGHEVGDAPMTCAEFQGRAWQAANAKARELGWIV